MNGSAVTLEILLAVLAFIVLMAGLWTPPSQYRPLGWITAALVGCLLVFSWGELAPGDTSAFGGMFVVDSMARLFKGLFLLSAMVIVLMATEYTERLPVGPSEFYALTLLATCGMMFASSANDLMMMFAGLELVTVTFYVLTSFHRNQLSSLEAGVKYLIMGAVSSGFLVFGMALVFGAANSTQFSELFRQQAALANSSLFLAGLVLIVAGLAFKIAAFPFQMWAPDVYQGAPIPTTAFLAVGSKAAGFVLLIRLLSGAVPMITAKWSYGLAILGVITILYGSLCALSQTDFKRMMGYSSVANAGYLVLGLATMSISGTSAMLYYLMGYSFTVMAAFGVLTVISSQGDASLVGLGKRSPGLAAVMTLAMASLAGIPPAAGFFGKFLLLRSLLNRFGEQPWVYMALAAAVAGVVMSLYYYFSVLRVMYWDKSSVRELEPPRISGGMKIGLAICCLGILALGIAPNGLLQVTNHAAESVSNGIKKAPVVSLESAH